MKKPLTIKDVATITGFNARSVFNAIHAGLLKATMFGNTWMIWPNSLEEYIRNHPRPSRLAHVSLEAFR